MATWSRIIGLAAVIGVLVGCTGAAPTPNKNEALAKRAEQKPAPIPVEAQLPTRGSLSEFFETTTRVEADRSVQVTSEGVGKCLRILVDEGDSVSKGDVLAELDTSELNTQLASARTQLAKAKADYNRARESVKEGLVAPLEFENAKYALEQQQASVDQLNVQLGNMTVRAPLSGIVTQKMAQVGQIISSGSPCFEIIDPQSYVLNINVPEKGYLSRIEVGQAAAVKLDSLDEEVTAKVRRINPAVDPTSGTVKVTLGVEKSALSKLRNHAFARVNVVLATHENALLVPKNAVVEENTRKYIYVVELPAVEDAETAADEATKADETILIASRREVMTGLEDSTNVEILEGIADSDRVVTVGQQTLKSGAEVKLTSVQGELLANARLSAEEALQAAKDEHAEDKSESPAP
ncbi:MAG: efflux RND transporter periplasmic adaptor subunit [Candidatus Hydrogenedentes bacterium]|nr:efflux RND transporter periplasmic adaptor subunit [Candidatus Hydrogenedentota bacterium]